MKTERSSENARYIGTKPIKAMKTERSSENARYIGTKPIKAITVRMDEKMYNRFDRVVKASTDIRLTRGELLYSLLYLLLDTGKPADDIKVMRNYVMKVRTTDK